MMDTRAVTSPAQDAHEPLLARMRRRRVSREFTGAPVAAADVRLILEAGRWASSASNLHIHKFVVVDDPRLVDLVKEVSPGILGNPTTLIVICTDLARCQEVGVRPHLDRTRYIDVGTAAMNMLLMAQDVRLGACPVTSFSQRAVALLLDLPATLIPELMVLLGHPLPSRRSLRAGAHTQLTVEDLSFIARPDQGLQRLAPEDAV
ncbi:MAG TPA: nitroreductase family protein [Chloroflexota bacterium]|nr:nitroreductase family protein [Chloroflexota bacterium]